MQSSRFEFAFTSTLPRTTSELVTVCNGSSRSFPSVNVVGTSLTQFLSSRYTVLYCAAERRDVHSLGWCRTDKATLIVRRVRSAPPVMLYPKRRDALYRSDIRGILKTTEITSQFGRDLRMAPNGYAGRNGCFQHEPHTRESASRRFPASDGF